MILLVVTLLCCGWFFTFRKKLNEIRERAVKKMQELKNKIDQHRNKGEPADE